MFWLPKVAIVLIGQIARQAMLLGSGERGYINGSLHYIVIIN